MWPREEVLAYVCLLLFPAAALCGMSLPLCRVVHAADPSGQTIWDGAPLGAERSTAKLPAAPQCPNRAAANRQRRFVARSRWQPWQPGACVPSCTTALMFMWGRGLLWEQLGPGMREQRQVVVRPRL